MKKKLLVLSMLVSVLLAGCSFKYKATSLNALNPQAIVASTKVNLAPVAWQFQRPADWESDEEWQKHTSAWHEALNKQLVENLGERLQPIDDASAQFEGVLVQITVNQIVRKWNAFSGGYDQVHSTLSIRDAKGQELLNAQLISTSKRYTPEGWSFGGRIKSCFINLGTAVAKIVQNGTL